MSLRVGRAILNDAVKDLKTHWDRTKMYWDDPVSREFEEKHLRSIEARVRAAMSAMDNIAEVAARVQRDCE